MVRKVLQLAAIDTTVRFLLLPLLERLTQEGFEVHVACTPGPHLAAVVATGVSVHEISMARRIGTLRHLSSLVQLVRLMRRERFDIVHVHTPIAAVLGRVAAKLARVPVVIYTVHGFYFHERMSAWKRRLIIWVERLLGRQCTDLLLTVSKEDRDTAVAERIARADRVVWIGGGVDVDAFECDKRVSLPEEFGIRPSQQVVGFIGRIVREKGVIELVRAMQLVLKQQPEALLLIVGETLGSDRDRGTRHALRQQIEEHGMADKVRFTGFRDDAARLIGGMDVFVLPSHREGLPQSILEAMASGVPVVATDIRGCREEVVDGETGFLVPVNDPDALAHAIERILTDASLAQRLGEAGRRRVEHCFRESGVLDRQMEAIRALTSWGDREAERR
ncbi:glycosyltransferase family 4 protein [Candidatus Bipolaricaulota bacterium]